MDTYYCLKNAHQTIQNDVRVFMVHMNIKIVLNNTITGSVVIFCGT